MFPGVPTPKTSLDWCWIETGDPSASESDVGQFARLRLESSVQRTAGDRPRRPFLPVSGVKRLRFA